MSDIYNKGGEMDRINVRLSESDFKKLNKLDGITKTEKIRTAIKLANKYNKGKKNLTKEE